MKDFTERDALRNLKNWSDYASRPSDEDVAKELTRLRSLSNEEKRKVKASFGLSHLLDDLEERVNNEIHKTACISIRVDMTDARAAPKNGNLTQANAAPTDGVVASGLVEHYDDIGLTLNANAGTISGFKADVIYKLEYHVANALDTSARPIQTFYGVTPVTEAHTWASYSRGVCVSCPLTTNDRTNDHNSRSGLGIFVPRNNNEILNFTYFSDAYGLGNTLKIRNLLFITRIK